MFIKELKLINFRNYRNINIGLARNFNIFYGDNGQGKTNILEAIFLCASGRSHRTSKDIDLVNLSENGYFVKVNMVRNNMDASIEISFNTTEKKKIKINEIPAKKMGSLMGNLNAVIFSPEDLLIIKEGPSERRRFIDITISQLKPSYFYDLQQYNKVLSQRNMLLKEIQQKKYLIDTLEVWNNNLVNIGSRIIKVRQEFINKLDKSIEKNHSKLTNGKEKLTVRYVPSITVNGYDDILDIQKAFHKVLENSAGRELIKASTLHGPQRDDFELFLNGISLKLYGSQGQQRTAILSMKLSEIDIIKEDTGEYPVLLLDDVMSELDNKRQEYLLDNLNNIQTFVTCTEKNFFNSRLSGDYRFYNVSSGEAVSEQ